MSPTKWKMINIDEKQVEIIENLTQNPKLAKYSFKSVPDFIGKAITFYIIFLEKEFDL